MTDHYFSHEPTVPDVRHSVDVTLRGHQLTMATADGVFSTHRLDLGTEVLLRTVPDPPSRGNLLDLGCGWGPVTVALAKDAPQCTVWAVDVNARALDLTRENAARLGLTNVRAVLPDEVPAEVEFDVMWSNPPIRIGKPALHELLERWLPRLTVDASAYLVVQRNLGADSLLNWLNTDATFPAGVELETSKLGSAKGFRVLQVERRG